MKTTIISDLNHTPASRGLVAQVIALVVSGHGGVPIASTKFIRQTSTPPTYKYTIVHIDGRKWKQDIVFVDFDDPDPLRKRTGNDFWSDAEAAVNREILELLVKKTNLIHVEDATFEIP